MPSRYIGDDFEIDSHSHLVTISGSPVKIRPKTFQLLLILIDRAGHIVDKNYLLENVWNDVNVEEYVVFQSIAELRKIFAERRVIQTHPRKGYSWVAKITKQNAESLHPTGNVKKLKKSAFFFSKIQVNKLLITASFSLCLFIIVVAGYFFKNSLASYPSSLNKLFLKQSSETIFILPTKNRLMDNNFDWVSLGIMDTLISKAVDHQKIMPLEYVLSSMRMAELDRNYNNEQIDRLMKITGAGIIVESELSRRLGDYQLVYKLHYSNTLKRGVFFNPSMSQVIEELAGVIASLADITPNDTKVTDSNFKNEMLVEAIMLAKNGAVDSGIHLLKSLVLLEQNNFQAQRLLIDWLQYNRDFEQALLYSEAVLKRIDKNNPSLSGFYYRHAYNLYRLDRIDESWQFLILLQQQLLTENNPLYIGLSHQLEGELLLKSNQLASAKKAFLSSLQQFEQINHSVGMTAVHCLLAKTERLLGNTEQESYHLDSARRIVKKYEIKDLLIRFRIKLDLLES